MPDLIAIAYAAGFSVEQFKDRGTCAVKYEAGEIRYGIPLDHFADIVSAAQHDDKARLDKLQSMAEDGVVSVCFEIDGGFHVTHDPMGGEQQAARDQKDVRAGLDWHITNLTSTIPL